MFVSEPSISAIREANYFLETVVPRFEKGEIEGSETNIKH